MSAPKKLKFRPATDMPKKRRARVLREGLSHPATSVRFVDPPAFSAARMSRDVAFVSEHLGPGRLAVRGQKVAAIVLDEPLVLSGTLPPGGGSVSGNFAEDIANGTLVDKLRSAGVQVEVPTAEEEAAELAAMANMTQEELNERFGLSPEDVTEWQQQA